MGKLLGAPRELQLKESGVWPSAKQSPFECVAAHPTQIYLLCKFGFHVLEFLKIGLTVEPHSASEIKPGAGSAGSSVTELVCGDDGHSLKLGSKSQLKPQS